MSDGLAVDGGVAEAERPAAALLASERLGVRVRRVEGAPVVALRVWLRSGARVESIPGQALVAGRMLAEGTRRRSWKRIADEAEARGMILASFGGFEVHGLAIDALAQDLELALGWAAELLLESVFPEDRTAWLARQAAAELGSLADQPEIKTAWGFLEQLYAPHPRSRPVQGDPASLLALTPDDLAGFHRRALGSRVLVTAAGRLDEDAVERRVRELFAALPPPAPPWPEPAAPAGTEPRRRLVAVEAEEQAHLYLGHLTVPRRHPDHAALELLAVILGSGTGLTGRIPTRIREREGLAYSAHAQTLAGAGLDAGRLVAYVATAPANADRAEQGVVEELRRLVEGGIKEAELDDARAYLLGREPFRRETARQWADLLAEAEHYELPLEDARWRAARLAELDRTAVEEAARRHVRPDDLAVTIGLPEGDS
ncbi:MAG TPA: pitrilysin family protein [Thermoanaerobaculia bacterium]|nr:pitrilysin family protein [Thermoanaerobaculia bacterium]